MTGPYCIALTGGIGSGKSSATGFFSELGVPVIDADAISHELVLAGQPALQEIVEEFGKEVIGNDGELRRGYLRSLIFDDPDARQKLESIIHPKVRSEINRRINKVGYPYCIVSIPLLIESGGEYDFDRIIVIDAPESLQIQRASHRDDSSLDEIEKIVKSQISRQLRLQGADDVIVNDRDLAFLKSMVESLHQKYLLLAAERKASCS